MRYFIYSANYNTKNGFAIGEFNCTVNKFPTKEALKKNLWEYLKSKQIENINLIEYDKSEIVILSFCELSEQDYNIYLEE